MLTLLMLAGGMGIAGSTAALWMQGRQMVHQRMFAALISAAVTVTLFSVVAWVAAAPHGGRAGSADLAGGKHARLAVCTAAVSRIADLAGNRQFIARPNVK
jgi:hypothetical protein